MKTHIWWFWGATNPFPESVFPKKKNNLLNFDLDATPLTSDVPFLRLANSPSKKIFHNLESCRDVPIQLSFSSVSNGRQPLRTRIYTNFTWGVDIAQNRW